MNVPRARVALAGFTGIVAMLTTAPAALASSASVYVAAAGSDGANMCALAASPCASVMHALTEVSAGGTVYVAGTIDVYNATADAGDQNGITVAQNVTIAQDPDGAGAIISGPSNTTLEPGSLLTISGAHTVELNGLTFEDGDSSGFHGGAVSNNLGGNLTVSGCTFTHNGSGQRFEAMTGGALDNGDQGSGTLTVTDSTFTDNQAGANGGALDNADNHGSGTVTIEGSTFTGNSDTHNNGGAIDNADNFGAGVMMVANSTFNDNTDTANGGAIDNGNDGGVGTLTVNTSTFDQNGGADGGAIDNGNDGNLPGSPGHGSGILTVADSTFTRNHATRHDGGAIDSADNGGTASVSVTDSTFSTNETGQDGGAIDSGDHGGDGTLTIASSAFSGNAAPQSDGGAIDSGDNGSQGSVSVTGSTFTDNEASVQDGGAIDSADHGSNGALTIASSTFSGNQALQNDGGAIDSADNGAQGSLVVTDSTFSRNSSPQEDGGAIDSGDLGGSGTARISGSTFNANTAASGGALSNGSRGSAPSTLTIDGSTFTGNDATQYDGGAIESADDGTATLAITGSTFSDNEASVQDGGAIDSGDHGGNATLVIAGSAFSGNQAPQNDGGAIDSADNGAQGTLVVAQSTFSGNSSPQQDGGAIDSGDLGGSGMARISGSTFSGNSAASGGALSSGSRGSTQSTLTIDGSTFTGNDAAHYDGGAIESADDGTATLDITGSTFSDNEASVRDGGAIDSGDHGGNGALTIAKSAFTGNQAPQNDGGAIDSADNGAQGSLVVTDSTFSGNSSPQEDGGAIDSGDLGGSGMARISGSTFSGNSAESGGALSNGARNAGQGGLTITADTFAGNTSPQGPNVASRAGALGGTGNGTVYEAGDVFDGSCTGNTSGWTDGGYNASSSASCLGAVTAATDAVVSSAVGSELEPLAGNGATLETILLRADDPAVGLIPANAPSVTLDGKQYSLCPTTDERGYANPGGSACNAGATQLAVPVITAKLTSVGKESSAGWWNAPVTASFTCLTVAALTAPCPAPVTFSANSAGQSVNETITGTDDVGGDSVTVSGINVDQSAPTIAIGGPVNGRRYRRLPPGSSCRASETISGLASCSLVKTFTKTASGYRETVMATATSNAGVQASARIRFTVDQAPSVRITGPVAGATYLGMAPRARCRATRTASPIRSCSLRRVRKRLSDGYRETLRARAVSRAGQVAKASRTFVVETSVPPRVVHHRPLYDQVYALAYGHSYRIVVIGRSRPRYVFAVPAPLQPRGGNLPFHRVGTVHGLPRWLFVVRLPRKLSDFPAWNIGVRIGGQLDVITVRRAG